ncbi:metal tolerance protein C1 isoform X2 [Asparagus officinalis]|uniref:metal tolerance protein C1 isoform X1 n=1 Tax=Asparagus officinalis TaxID=4686 RepID=UPI00098E3A8A|nr:metal tolerance protein C1 isoform X1 [Asparagus officinalis]XP_020250350.1 metal tolerance protein C1 isoform X1 [Asparagus officinalis]XP_020250351.1 metal tolerance protein C1 isoform X2 [Asparagus officinalis]
MLLTTAGGIAWHAVNVLQGIITAEPEIISHILEHSYSDHHSHGGGHHHGIDLEHPVLALSMTTVSIAVKEGLFWITRKAGEKEGSELMTANAWHHRSDAVSSVVALIGVGGTMLGMPFLDPVAGILVSGMILKAGIETGYRSVMELVDAGVPLPTLAPIKQTITQVEGVKGCHRLRGRKAGSFLYLDVHIEVDPFLSVSAAHDIGENVRRQVQKSHKQVAEVFIHIDPSFLCSSSIVDQRQTLKGVESQNSDKFCKERDAEAIVSGVISSLFAEKMTVKHITRHLLQGKILLEVQVSMPLEMSIRDAMDVTKEAEKEILNAAPCISQVSIQLSLGNPVPQFYSSTIGGNKENQGSQS